MAFEAKWAERRFQPLRWLARGLVGMGTGIGVALGALRDNKLRAGLTALGIIIGVMTVVGILGVIHGLNSAVESQMDLLGSRSLYVGRHPWFARGRWFKYRNRPPITDWQYRRLRELVPFAEAVAPMEDTRSYAERGPERIDDVEVRGTNSEFLRIMGLEIERGRFLSPADVEFERPYVVLGAEVASRLFPRGDPLGDHITIRGNRYEVIGVFKARGSFLGRSQDVHATMPVGRFRRSFGSRHSMDIGIKVAPGLDMEVASQELAGIMRRVRALRPKQPDDFSINQQEQMGKFYDDVTGELYLVIVVVAAISLLIGGISIMNIMMVSVTERTREIGIRKALGARRRSILFQFLIESLVLAGLGGLVGLGGGFMVVHVVDSVSPLPAKVFLGAVVAGLGFASAIGLFFGLYPAWRASRLDPIEALRYE